MCGLELGEIGAITWAAGEPLERREVTQVANLGLDAVDLDGSGRLDNASEVEGWESFRDEVDDPVGRERTHVVIAIEQRFRQR